MRSSWNAVRWLVRLDILNCTTFCIDWLFLKHLVRFSTCCLLYILSTDISCYTLVIIIIIIIVRILVFYTSTLNIFSNNRIPRSTTSWRLRVAIRIVLWHVRRPSVAFKCTQYHLFSPWMTGWLADWPSNRPSRIELNSFRMIFGYYTTLKKKKKQPSKILV